MFQPYFWREITNENVFEKLKFFRDIVCIFLQYFVTKNIKKEKFLIHLLRIRSYNFR